MSAASRAIEAAKALHGKVDGLIRGRGGYRRAAVALAATWLVGIPLAGSIAAAGLGLAAVPKATLYAVTRGLSIACELALAAEGVAALNTFVVPKAAHALSGVIGTARDIAERLSKGDEEKSEVPETDCGQKTLQQAMQAKEDDLTIVEEDDGPTYEDYVDDPLDYLDDEEYWEELKVDPAYDGESPEYFDKIDEENLRAVEVAYEKEHASAAATAPTTPAPAATKPEAKDETIESRNEAKELAAGWAEIIDYARAHYPTPSHAEKAYLISTEDAEWLFKTDARGNWAHAAEDLATRWPGATALVITEENGRYSSVAALDDPTDGRFCESFVTLPAAIAYGSNDIDLDDLQVFDAAAGGDAGLLSHIHCGPSSSAVRRALAGFEGWSPNGDGRTVAQAWEECGEIPITSRRTSVATSQEPDHSQDDHEHDEI